MNIKNAILAFNRASIKSNRYINLVPISPKDQNDLSGIVAPVVGSNNWSPDVDYEYLQKIYDCHDLVWSCIELVSSTFALAELKVKKKDSNGKHIYVPDHPIQRVLDNPNSSMTGYDLRQAYVVHRLLFGTMAFILLRDEQLNDDSSSPRVCPTCINEGSDSCNHYFWYYSKGPVKRILPINLELLKLEKYETSNGIKEYHTYTFDNKKVPIHPDNLMTDPFYNPGGSFIGVSPTAQVKRWLEVDLGMSHQVSAYLVNNAIPSMIVNLKPPASGQYDEDPSTILQKMKEKWMRDFSFGGKNPNQGSQAKTPAFVSGELDIHKIQDSLKEIVVKDLFYEIQARISMAYGVPPSFFEFGQKYGSQSTTIEQQEKNFFNRTISKYLKSFKAKIERYVLSSYPDEDLILEWDLRGMGIASFLEQERKNNILKSWELGLTSRDETREQLGLNPIGGEVGDDLYRITLMSDAYGNNQNQPKPHEDNLLKPRSDLNE